MPRYGYTQKEAQAAYHLDRAWDFFEELHEELPAGDPDNPPPDLEGSARRVWESIHHEIYGHTSIHIHFRELRRFLGMRVLLRDYPEGWGEQSTAEEGEG